MTANILGYGFGEWLVLEHKDCDRLGNSQWLCECSCGTLKILKESTLVQGLSISCGCLHGESFQEPVTPTLKSSMVSRIRELRKYRVWRQDVLQRDKYTCQFSGDKDVKLHVHHIETLLSLVKKYNIKSSQEAISCKELWDVENGITLSVEYHMSYSPNPQAFHRIYGTYTTKNNFNEWIKNSPFIKKRG